MNKTKLFLLFFLGNITAGMMHAMDSENPWEQDPQERRPLIAYRHQPVLTRQNAVREPVLTRENAVSEPYQPQEDRPNNNQPNVHGPITVRRIPIDPNRNIGRGNPLTPQQIEAVIAAGRGLPTGLGHRARAQGQRIALRNQPVAKQPRQP